jgi:hypothetical protein
MAMTLSKRQLLMALAALPATLLVSGSLSRRADASSDDARSLLEGMGKALAAASTMRFRTVTTMDAGSSPPFPAVYRIVGKARVLFARPDRLRVQYGGEPPEAELLFDGKQTTVFMPRIGAKALLPAPSGNGEITGVQADQALAPHALFLPFVDIVTDRPGVRFTGDVRQAEVVLRDMPVDDVATDVVFAATPLFQGEVWIGRGDNLPRRIVGAYSPGAGVPSFSAATAYSGWVLNEAAPDADFQPAGIEAAKTMDFAGLWTL